jgi:hypothetical protein
MRDYESLSDESTSRHSRESDATVHLWEKLLKSAVVHSNQNDTFAIHKFLMLLQRISISDVRQCRRPEHAVKRCHYSEILVCQRTHDVNEGGRQYDPEYAGWCVISRETPRNELCDPMREQKAEEYQRSYHFVATLISGDTKQLDKKAYPRGQSPIP